MKGPCKNCEARTIGCHAECAKYLEFQARLMQAKEREAKDQLPKLFLYESVRKAYIKNQRKTKITGGKREQ